MIAFMTSERAIPRKTSAATPSTHCLGGHSTHLQGPCAPWHGMQSQTHSPCRLCRAKSTWSTLNSPPAVSWNLVWAAGCSRSRFHGRGGVGCCWTQLVPAFAENGLHLPQKDGSCNALLPRCFLEAYIFTFERLSELMVTVSLL